MSFRILFADDQIPPENITQEEFKKQFFAKSDNKPFFEQCIFVGDIIQTLRDSGYAITTARKFQNALKEIENSIFDLAIIDLGWHMDVSLPESERGGAGWKLCDKLDEKDLKDGRRTPQILFSNKFPEHPDLSWKAASRKKLPIYKVSTDFIKSSLMATVGFVESTAMSVSGKEPQGTDNFNHELQNIALDSFKQPIREYRQWTVFTLVFVGISLCTLITGILFTFLNKIDIGLISSVSSIISGTISAVLYKRLNSVQKLVENIRKELMDQINLQHP
jgi:hypothetical protein